MSPLCGIRGATQAEADTGSAIGAATRELLLEMVARNGVDPDAVTAIWFTQTPDLTAAYPAATARALGWDHVPLMCAQEARVAGSLPRIVRVLMLAPLDARPADVRHVYLGAARALRQDLDPEEGP